MWWWIEPMLKTGILCLFVGSMIFALGKWLDENNYGTAASICVVFGAILMLPIIVGFGAFIVNMLCILAHLIWAPYI